MGNPVITEITAGANYSVSDSARVHATFLLTMAFGEANFDVTFPVAAAPTISFIRTLGGNVTLTVPAAVEQQNLTIANRVVSWQTSDGGGTRTLHVRVEDTTFTAINEEWVIKISGLPALVAATVVAGTSASINLIEADPLVEILTPDQNKKELEPVTLQARARKNTLPLPAGAGCAGVTLAWSQNGGDPVTAMPGVTGQVVTVVSGAPGCQGEATVNLPGLTASVDLHYTFSVTIGEFSNTGAAIIHAATRVRHSMLVVDRSGSMLGDKWNNAIKAAHIWLDLLTAFRSGVGASDRVGIMVFEDSDCNFRVAGAPDGDVKLEFPVPGGNPGAYPVLPAPVSLLLGAPGDCTPIGDSLIVALNKMIGLPGTPSDNFYSVLLMTDGLENAGTVRVDREAPPPLVAGVEIFETIRSINDGAHDRSIFHFTDPGRNVRFYAVGVGPDGGVSTDVLDDLAYGDVATAPGYYRLVSNVRDMVPAFGEMLGHDIGAARQVAFAAPPSGIADPNAPGAGMAAYFLVPSGEEKLVVALLWNGVTDDLELRWRHQAVVGEAFAAVPGGAISVHKRATHAVVVVDLTSGGLNATG